MAEREPGHGWSGRPARSGADTPRSTNIVQHGGKIDPDALLKRIQQTQPPAPSEASDGDDAPAPLVPAAEGDLVVPASPDDDSPNRVAFVLQRDLNKRLDKYLTDRITFMSRTQLQRLIDEGGVTVNGGKCKASTKLRSGDKVEVYVPPPPPTEIQPEDIPLQVLYEDEHLIVINKTPDIIVHPARAHNKGTMINALAFHFQNRSGGALSGVGREFARPGVVHRLDRQTSGLIVFAKSDEAHWRIGQQFEQRTVDKRYLALVHGLYEPPIDTIDLPLGPHPSKERGYREKFVVRHDALGKQSLTIARVRQVFRIPSAQVEAAPSPVRPTLGWDAEGPGAADAGHGRGTHGAATRGPGDARDTGFSLVELELKSGRTHQIRVHLTHRGYPIAGDDMYGGKPLAWDEKEQRVTSDIDRTPGAEMKSTQIPLMGRVALHAATLAFKHPADGRPMSFTAPLPTDLASTLDALRRMDKLSVALTPPGATVSIPDRT
jgi:23S rRNA pseudouridine1911/1915/1917 synthase